MRSQFGCSFQQGSVTWHTTYHENNRPGGTFKKKNQK